MIMKAGLPDCSQFTEIKAGVGNRCNFTGGYLVGINRQIVIGIDLQRMVQNGAGPVKIEVAVMGNIADGRLIADGGDFELQTFAIKQAVGSLYLTIAGKPGFGFMI